MSDQGHIPRDRLKAAALRYFADSYCASPEDFYTPKYFGLPDDTSPEEMVLMLGYIEAEAQRMTKQADRLWPR